MAEPLQSGLQRRPTSVCRPLCAGRSWQSGREGHWWLLRGRVITPGNLMRFPSAI